MTRRELLLLLSVQSTPVLAARHWPYEPEREARYFQADLGFADYAADPEESTEACLCTVRIRARNMGEALKLAKERVQSLERAGFDGLKLLGVYTRSTGERPYIIDLAKLPGPEGPEYL